MPESNIEQFKVGHISGVGEEANKKLIDKKSEQIIQETEKAVNELNSLPEKEYTEERRKILEETGTEDLSHKQG